jgi:hypothetical protein
MKGRSLMKTPRAPCVQSVKRSRTPGKKRLSTMVRGMTRTPQRMEPNTKKK